MIASTQRGLSIPIISFNTLFHITSTFGLLNNLSWSIFSALKVSLLCINITFLANLVRNKASSTAVFPPPITAIISFLKKNPSHVAHAETPNPLYLSSDFKPSHLA